jgi:hypothetical protein
LLSRLPESLGVGHDNDVVALENLYGLDARPSPGGSDDDILDAELLGALLRHLQRLVCVLLSNRLKVCGQLLVCHLHNLNL